MGPQTSFITCVYIIQLAYGPNLLGYSNWKQSELYIVYCVLLLIIGLHIVICTDSVIYIIVANADMSVKNFIPH